MDYNKTYPLPLPAVSRRIPCPQCGGVVSLAIVREDIGFHIENGHVLQGKPIGWRYRNPFNGPFCTQRCATIYAKKLYKVSEHKLQTA